MLFVDAALFGWIAWAVVMILRTDSNAAKCAHGN